VIRLDEHGVPFVVAALAAAGVSMLLGVLVGLPATRVRGMSLAITTLALAVAVEQLVLASPPFSGGPAGSSAPRPSLFGLDLGVSARGADNFRPQFGVFVLVVLAASCVAVANLRRNGTGLRWLAVRANERAAAAAGIDVGRTKLGAFATSSFLAGLAGVLMAESTATLSPTSFMVIGARVVLALTYLGGVASIGGALVAGLLAQAGLVTTISADLSGGDVGQYVFATSGIALILTAIFAPDGLTGLAHRAVERVVGPPAASVERSDA
jgi:ABC-type branched-subunit amino acid transport system permease subunit